MFDSVPLEHDECLNAENFCVAIEGEKRNNVRDQGSVE